METLLQYFYIFDAYYLDNMIVSECDSAFHIVLIKNNDIVSDTVVAFLHI